MLKSVTCPDATGIVSKIDPFEKRFIVIFPDALFTNSLNVTDNVDVDEIPIELFAGE